MAQGGRREIKGPSNGPCQGGQAPAASDAIPERVPLPAQCLLSHLALFSVAMTLTWQEEVFWGLTGRATNVQLSWCWVPTWGREVPVCPTDCPEAKKESWHPNSCC